MSMSARQGWWTFVAAGVTAASLASCSGQSDPPQSTTATSTATAAAATTPSPTPDALAACTLIGDGEDDSIIDGDGNRIDGRRDTRPPQRERRFAPILCKELNRNRWAWV